MGELLAAAQGESDTARMGDGFVPRKSSLLRSARGSVSWHSSPPIPAERMGSSRAHPTLPRGKDESGSSCRGRVALPARGVCPGRPARVVLGSGSSPAAHPDPRVIEKPRWPLQCSQSPFSPADCNQHLIHTPLFTNFPGGIMLMKGARQSSSLPEVGKSRGKEERTAARKKRGVGQARLG